MKENNYKFEESELFKDAGLVKFNRETVPHRNEFVIGHPGVRKEYVVELSITQTYTTKVVVQGDYQDRNDPAIEEHAKLIADEMDHNKWDYRDTEFEIDNITAVPESLSSYHRDLLNAGYSLEKVKSYSDEDAEAEWEAMKDSL